MLVTTFVGSDSSKGQIPDCTLNKLAAFLFFFWIGPVFSSKPSMSASWPPKADRIKPRLRACVFSLFARSPRRSVNISWPPLCDPAAGLPDQEEPRRVLAGRRPPPLSPPTRHYRLRSNKVTTKGGGHSLHTQPRPLPSEGPV